MGLLAGKMGMMEEGREFCAVAKKVDPEYTDRLLRGLLGIVEGDGDRARSDLRNVGRRFLEKREEKKKFR
jgi:hypothetical protein